MTESERGSSARREARQSMVIGLASTGRYLRSAASKGDPTTNPLGLIATTRMHGGMLRR
jgi:hypothetical protein